MKINDKELTNISLGHGVVEGRLHFRRSGGSVVHNFKEKWFKLRYNLLFYFDLNETGNLIQQSPTGIIVIENCVINNELFGDTPFSFSITFNDEMDKKIEFSGRSIEDVNKWVAALKQCSYEYLRAQLIYLQRKLIQLTGKDPLLTFSKEQRSKFSNITPNTYLLEERTTTQHPPRLKTISNVDILTELDMGFQSNYFNSLDAIGVKQSKVPVNVPTLIQPITYSRVAPPPPPVRPQRTKSSTISTNLIDL